ncbi:hypothetical protein BKA82DRAFT_4230351 [Pisolithus tinctorius]|nr:hypothetical protein BKA82DRAFT_4230351 [Pisolithus tinctorius]
MRRITKGHYPAMLYLYLGLPPQLARSELWKGGWSSNSGSYGPALSPLDLFIPGLEHPIISVPRDVQSLYGVAV